MLIDMLVFANFLMALITNTVLGYIRFIALAGILIFITSRE